MRPTEQSVPKNPRIVQVCYWGCVARYRVQVGVRYLHSVGNVIVF